MPQNSHDRGAPALRQCPRDHAPRLLTREGRAFLRAACEIAATESRGEGPLASRADQRDFEGPTGQRLRAGAHGSAQAAALRGRGARGSPPPTKTDTSDDRGLASARSAGRRMGHRGSGFLGPATSTDARCPAAGPARHFAAESCRRAINPPIREDHHRGDPMSEAVR